MDDWLNSFGEALAAELSFDTPPPGEWEDPDEAGADVSSWASPAAAHADAGGAAFHPAVDAEVRESLLETARVVAHATERRNAPLATFLIGRYVAARVAHGGDALAAAEEARGIAERLAG